MTKFKCTKEGLKMLEKLMTNPYAWAILSICTVLSFVYGLCQGHKSKRKKEIACYKNSCIIVRGGKSIIPELELKYKNEEIQELIITKYAIWNSGNEVLYRKDIAETKVLQARCDGEKTKILDVKILQQNDDSNQFSITSVENACAKIDFDYANPKDGIVIQIMHTGETQDIKIECKIKGGKKVKILNKDRKIKYNKLFMNITMMVLGIWGFIMLLAMVILAVKMIVNIGQEFRESLISAIIYCGCAVLIVKVYYSLLKDFYYINIPEKLRKAIDNEEFYK